MLSTQRRAELLRLLTTEGTLGVAELADRLGASAATIRRDLAELAERGSVIREHGGARVNPASAERAFGDVAVNNAELKDAVAARAAELVWDASVVLIDIGTTTVRLARALRCRPLTIITSSLAVYQELANDTDVELVLLGGTVRKNYRSMVGFLTQDALRQVRADLAFIGTSGVRSNGDVMDSTTVEIPVKRGMMAAAQRTVLLADSGKFPGGGIGRVCEAGELDGVITNRGADPATLQVMREKGVEVHLA
ncbi:DeoR/GlpR family DNA-binding transcription regulator [Allonocardiopsis opalescens]|uniref:Lactose phosphotransferase system repressor n=1 Tax=Allonocardiopsis opalescens TaxID=1144618 RepID=A0A2T0Q771_9ACTN|nr:DeoR/GlpR family DNA-binding transcription regulator [Allonocardiopsis opalescens]PRX99631.1 DeoR family transcriptional regulator [Allonocardiopsis opalescens]